MKRITTFTFLCLAFANQVVAQFTTVTYDGSNFVNQNQDRIGHSPDGTFGTTLGKYATIGTPDFVNLGNPPSFSNLYGLAVSWSSDRGFVGLRSRLDSIPNDNNSDFVIAWGNDDGTFGLTPDRMLIEFHKFKTLSDPGLPTPINALTALPLMSGVVNVGFDVFTPTEQIHSNRGVRFEGLTTGGTINHLVGIDATGKLWRTSPTTGTTLNCTVNDFIPKVASSGTLECSQLYDNGTSVGIGHTGPFGFTVNSTNNLQPGPWTTTTSGTLKLRINGITMSDGYLISSDARFKTNITPLNNVLEKITALKGVYYNWNTEAFPDRNFTQTTQIGFIAQDMAKVFPDLVYTDENGYASINYTELIPVMIQAIKEQQDIIHELKRDIQNAKLHGSHIAPSTKSVLYQNTPNPFNNTTEIRYFITSVSENTKVLCNVYDLNGRQLLSNVISERNKEGTWVISSGQLGSGMYLYTLLVDGREIDTKKMIVYE